MSGSSPIVLIFVENWVNILSFVENLRTIDKVISCESR